MVKVKSLRSNLKTMEYGARKKPKFANVEAAKPLDDLKQRLKALCTGGDKSGEFYRHFHYGLFSYISHRFPKSLMNYIVLMMP